MEIQHRYFSTFTEAKFKSKVTWIFFVLFVGSSIYILTSLYKDSFLARDAAQCLSAAQNFMQGRGFSTSILYYEVHHQFGYIPVPQTVFPPGYPFFISLIAMLGLSPQYSAFLFSLACFNIIGVLIYQIARASDHSSKVGLILAGVWYVFVVNWFNVLMCLSEMSYILFTVISLGCIIRSEKNSRKMWLFFASASAALGFTIRHAGIFYILSFLLFFFIAFLRKKSRESFYELLLAGSLPVFSIIGILGRNYLITGSTTINTYPSGDSIINLLYRYYYALSVIFGFSKSGFVNLDIPELSMILFCLIFIIFLIFKLNKLKFNKMALHNIFIKTASLFSLIYVSVSLLFMAYFQVTVFGMSTRTPIDRYMIPLIPFCLLFLADLRLIPYFDDIFGKRVLSFLYWGALVVFLCGQVNTFSWYWENTVKTNEFEEIHSSLQKPFHSGTLLEFLSEKVTLKNPLLGNEPQILGGLLGRPVIGLASSLYSPQMWTFDEVKKTVLKYNISYVIFFPDLFGTHGEDDQIFFEEISKGNIPTWLEVILSSEKVFLFQVKLPN